MAGSVRGAVYLSFTTSEHLHLQQSSAALMMLEL